MARGAQPGVILPIPNLSGGRDFCSRLNHILVGGVCVKIGMVDEEDLQGGRNTPLVHGLETCKCYIIIP
jgi:hypothetical protein